MKIVWWMMGIVLLITVVVWQQWPVATPQITMCDVGQGDGLVVTQGFSQLVIDGGAVGAGMTTCLARVMPFWDKQIEVVVITHTDADHAGALDELLTHYMVEEVVTNERSGPNIKKIVNGRSRVRMAWAGQAWRWGLVTTQVVWPAHGKIGGDDNDDSLVLRMVVSPRVSVWLAADTGSDVEASLLQLGQVIPSTILKVAHHGSASASSAPFLAILRPSQAWISVGKGNRYGHPSRDVIERLQQIGAVIRRTDESGAIQMVK